MWISSTLGSMDVVGGLLLGTDNTKWFKINGFVSDFNNAIQAGIYSLTIGNIIPDGINGPNGQYGFGSLLVFCSGYGFVTQFYIPILFTSISKFFVRTRSEKEAWQEWRSVELTSIS